MLQEDSLAGAPLVAMNTASGQCRHDVTRSSRRDLNVKNSRSWLGSMSRFWCSPRPTEQPSHHVEQVFELDSADMTCPSCGGELRPMAG
jgi:hypothetical protein